jgi:uncharacterized protein (DUF305 family)
MRAVWRELSPVIVLALALVVGATVDAASSADSTAEAPFLAENRAAMDRMITGMDGAPTGDVDRDFAAMMIPHHQGAIDMAQAELRHGRNELLRRIAQEIVVEQQQEIEAMRLALGRTHAAAPPRGARPSLSLINMRKEP